MIETAVDLIHKPSIRYVRGHPELGQSPIDGFDCSGFVRFVLQQSGLHVPDFIGMDGAKRPIRHANEFWDHYGIGVHPEMRQTGDLIFFSRNGRFPTHVGIVRDPESYIHAPGRDNTWVEIASIAFRVIESEFYSVDPIGFKAPTVANESPTYRYHQRPVESINERLLHI